MITCTEYLFLMQQWDIFAQGHFHLVTVVFTRYEMEDMKERRCLVTVTVATVLLCRWRHRRTWCGYATSLMALATAQDSRLPMIEQNHVRASRVSCNPVTHRLTASDLAMTQLLICISTSLSFAGNVGRPIWLIKGTTAARAGLPISINVCRHFVCPNNGIYDCSCLVHGCWRMRLHRWLYRYHQRVGTKSCLWGKDPLLHLGCEPTSVLCLAFQLDALQTELFLPLEDVSVGLQLLTS